jgi:hypothetical protein
VSHNIFQEREREREKFFFTITKRLQVEEGESAGSSDKRLVSSESRTRVGGTVHSESSWKSLVCVLAETKESDCLQKERDCL